MRGPCECVDELAIAVALGDEIPACSELLDDRATRKVFGIRCRELWLTPGYPPDPTFGAGGAYVCACMELRCSYCMVHHGPEHFPLALVDPARPRVDLPAGSEWVVYWTWLEPDELGGPILAVGRGIDGAHPHDGAVYSMAWGTLAEVIEYETAHPGRRIEWRQLATNER